MNFSFVKHALSNCNLTLSWLQLFINSGVFSAVFPLSFFLQMYLQTLSTQSKSLGYLVSKTISLMLTAAKYKPFVSLTADELVFGYDDTLVSLAHKFYPRNKRPMAKMGLLNGVSCFRSLALNLKALNERGILICVHSHQLSFFSVKNDRSNCNQLR